MRNSKEIAMHLVITLKRSVLPALTLILGLVAADLGIKDAFAGDKHASREEAQQMATKAADLVKTEGPTKAFDAINKGKE